MYPLGGLVGQGYFLTAWPANFGGMQPVAATCVKNTATKELECLLGGTERLMVLPADYALGSSDLDSRVNSPLWNTNSRGAHLYHVDI
jgi:hypothetical protein